MSIILISGAKAVALAERLTAHGHTTQTAPTVADLRTLIPTLEEASVDLYIQLPVRVVTEGSNAVEVIGHFLKEGLLRRFDAASAVLPALRKGAGTMLVGGNHPTESGAPDNPEARISLMKVLGHALLLERPDELSVTIVGNDANMDRVVELATDILSSPGTVKAFSLWLEKIEEANEGVPDWDYADWRNSLLTMTETMA